MPHFSTLWNEHEEHISQMGTLLLYTYHWASKQQRSTDLVWKRKRLQEVKISTLYMKSSNTLEPLATSDLPSFSVKTSDCSNLNTHSDFASYVADFTECDDLLGLEREVSPASPCNRCFIKKEDFSISKKSRSVNQTLVLLVNLKYGSQLYVF